MGDEPHRCHAVGSRGRADRVLGCLHRWRVQRPATIQIERNPTVREQTCHLDRALDGKPAELDPVWEHEHVRREAVASEMGRLPELVRREMVRNALEEWTAKPRTAGVAATVPTDEDDRQSKGITLLQVSCRQVLE